MFLTWSGDKPGGTQVYSSRAHPLSSSDVELHLWLELLVEWLFMDEDGSNILGPPDEDGSNNLGPPDEDGSNNLGPPDDGILDRLLSLCEPLPPLKISEFKTVYHLKFMSFLFYKDSTFILKISS